MAENPEPRPEEVAVLSVSDLPHAPFIFYEAAPASGVTNGVVNITLSAHRTYGGAGGAIVNGADSCRLFAREYSSGS